MRLFLLIPFILINCQAEITFGNDLYWAQTVTHCSNTPEEGDFSSKQVIGVPNAFPFGSRNSKGLSIYDDANYGTIEVSFDDNYTATHLVIVENYLPGKITSVSLYTDYGAEVTLYKARPKQLENPYRTFILSFGKTTYRIQKVKIALSTRVIGYKPQLDAIGLADYSNEKKLLNDLTNLGLSEFKFYYSFAAAVEKLPEYINTEAEELKPVITPNGKRLYFARRNLEKNSKVFNPNTDIYYCDLLPNGIWSEPKNLGPPLNNDNNNGVSAISVDGNRMLLINHYENDGSPLEGASLTHKTLEGWSKPKKVIIKKFKNLNEYSDYTISNDGNVLFMAIQTPSTIGDQDIYISFKLDDESWSKPINLGPKINTIGAEFSPYLASDGRTLYFASTGHNPVGGSDIYFSKRLDATWLNWSIPRNMGNLINSEKWEGYYSVEASGRFAYFSRSENVRGGTKDIYKILLPKRYRPDPVVLLNGTIFDLEKQKPIRANIIYKEGIEIDQETKTASNPETGTFGIVLTKPQQATLSVESPGYEHFMEPIKINIEDANYITVVKNIYLKKIDNNTYDMPDNIYFDVGGTTIRSASKEDLNRLIASMQNNKYLNILISGHSGNVGSDNLKEELSVSRAEKVKQILIDNGIEKSRITTEGLSDSQLKSKGDPKTKYLNRRVDILITKENDI